MGKTWLSLLLIGTLNAGVVKFWSADELANARALAVVRVEQATQGPPKQGFVPHAQYDVRTCNAQLKILRSFPVLNTTTANLSYSCNGPLGLRGNMPTYPWLSPGETYLIPLASVEKHWSLIGDQGVRLAIPVLAREPQGVISTRREFLAREIANLLVNGSFHQAYLAGADLGMDRSSTFADDLMAQLSAVMEPNSSRWVDVATALLANPYLNAGGVRDGMPKSSVTVQTELSKRMLGRISERDQHRLTALNVVSGAYLLGSSRQAEFSNAVREDIVKFLPNDLTELRPGATYIAWRLAETGDRALLALSLSAAQKILGSNLDPSHFDFNGAVSLLFGFGDQEQFTLYLRALRAARANGDPLRYWVLWHPALSRDGSRVLQAAAVLIDDGRPATEQTSYQGMRYCDIAVNRLQEVTGRQFGLVSGPQKAEERDVAIKHAREWLSSNMR